MRNESRPTKRRDLTVLVGTFAGLSLLLYLPELLLHGFGASGATALISAGSVARALFSWDVFVLFACYSLLPASLSEDGPLDRVGAACIVVLVLYAVYEAAVGAMLHRPPNFYADRPHLVGALYLVANGAVPVLHLVGLAAAVGMAGIAAWTLPALLTRVHRMLTSRPARPLVIVLHVMVWGGLLGSAAFSSSDEETRPPREARAVQGEAPKSAPRSRAIGLVQNVRRSIGLQRQIAKRWNQPADSTYARYLRRPIEERVPVYLVVLESYGSVLAASPETRSRYRRLMAESADSLDAGGWKIVTGRSEAPVFGGLSWLSVSSVLTGTPIAHQPVLDALRPELPHYPHLPRVLEEAGYATATVQAPVRKRPGLSVENPYGFDRTFYLEELDYGGPQFGWGIVPDQYSLAVAHEQFVERQKGPFFLLLETVSSHAPWEEPPPPLVASPTRESAYRADSPRHANSAFPSGSPVENRHLAHIRYQWRVLRQYIREHAPPESLFLVVGDHQPHFARHGGRSTPVHLIARNAELVRRLEPYHFQTGGLPPQFPTRLTHAGLYALLMEAILAPSSAPDSTRGAAEVYPRGVERAALLPTRRSRQVIQPGR